MKNLLTPLLLIICGISSLLHAQQRLRDYGIELGVLPTGEMNAITDVSGVRVGHATLVQGENIRTGVTAILPHSGNIFQEKVPAAIYSGNGFGKLAGYTQVEELGNIETPIILTNTLNVPTAANALIDYTLSLPENQKIRSVNPVVGETNDGKLNDIRGRHVTAAHVLEAIQKAGRKVEEGSVGAGTGTVCFGYKGGIGTSSRKLPPSLGGYTVGVLVQTNFGGVLQIGGAPIGKEMKQYSFSNQLEDSPDGSCMIVVMTDAPLDARNLKRLAKRAFLGLARTGGIASNGSGDYIIAISTAPEVRIPYKSKRTHTVTTVSNDYMSPIFLGAIEATEEAILNSLFMATKNSDKIETLPVEKVVEILKKYNLITAH